MRACLSIAALLLIASSPFTAFSQDSPKAAPSKPADKPAAVEAKPAEAKTDAKAADAKAADTKQVEVKKTAEKKKEAKKSTNRLPSKFGKLGLTDAQKTKVYDVQEKHESEIESLNEKLKLAKAKRDAEVEAVLTPAQKKLLLEMSATKTEEKKTEEKKTEEKKGEEKKGK